MQYQVETKYSSFVRECIPFQGCCAHSELQCCFRYRHRKVLFEALKGKLYCFSADAAVNILRPSIYFQRLLHFSRPFELSVFGHLFFVKKSKIKCGKYTSGFFCSVCGQPGRAKTVFVFPELNESARPSAARRAGHGGAWQTDRRGESADFRRIGATNLPVSAQRRGLAKSV